MRKFLKNIKILKYNIFRIVIATLVASGYKSVDPPARTEPASTVGSNMD